MYTDQEPVNVLIILMVLTKNNTIILLIAALTYISHNKSREYENNPSLVI